MSAAKRYTLRLASERQRVLAEPMYLHRLRPTHTGHRPMWTPQLRDAHTWATRQAAERNAATLNRHPDLRAVEVVPVTQEP